MHRHVSEEEQGYSGRATGVRIGDGHRPCSADPSVGIKQNGEFRSWSLEVMTFEYDLDECKKSSDRIKFDMTLLFCFAECKEEHLK
jgi:hypothetical protein